MLKLLWIITETAMDTSMDICLEPLKMAQNRSKKELVVHFSGEGCRGEMKKLENQHKPIGRVREVARYLGNMSHMNGTRQCEHTKRKKRARVGWQALRGIWSRSDIAMKTKSLVCSGLVDAALFAGQEAEVLRPQDLGDFDSLRATYARKLQKGNASGKKGEKGEERYSAWSNEKVMRKQDGYRLRCC